MTPWIVAAIAVFCFLILSISYVDKHWTLKRAFKQVNEYGDQINDLTRKLHVQANHAIDFYDAKVTLVEGVEAIPNFWTPDNVGKDQVFIVKDNENIRLFYRPKTSDTLRQVPVNFYNDKVCFRHEIDILTTERKIQLREINDDRNNNPFSVFMDAYSKAQSVVLTIEAKDGTIYLLDRISIKDVQYDVTAVVDQ